MEFYSENKVIEMEATVEALTASATEQGIPSGLAKALACTLYGKFDMYFVDKIIYDTKKELYTFVLNKGTVKIISREEWQEAMMPIIEDYNKKKKVSDIIQKF